MVGNIRRLRNRLIAVMDSSGAAGRARRTRQAALELPQAMSHAQAHMDETWSILASAPETVARAARGRLDEAERSLRSASVVRATDPVDAVAFARMAADLAGHAGRFARAGIRILQGVDAGCGVSCCGASG